MSGQILVNFATISQASSDVRGTANNIRQQLDDLEAASSRSPPAGKARRRRATRPASASGTSVRPPCTRRLRPSPRRSTRPLRTTRPLSTRTPDLGRLTSGQSSRKRPDLSSPAARTVVYEGERAASVRSPFCRPPLLNPSASALLTLRSCPIRARTKARGISRHWSPSRAPSPSGGCAGHGGVHRRPVEHRRCPWRPRDDPYVPLNSGECKFGTNDIKETPWSLQRVLLDELWQDTTGKGVRVAVIDTGVDAGNPQLRAHDSRRQPARSRSRRWRQARPSIRSATAPRSPASSPPARSDGTGFVGLAPEATIIPIRQNDGQGSGTSTADGRRPSTTRSQQRAPQVINISQDTDASR